MLCLHLDIAIYFVSGNKLPGFAIPETHVRCISSIWYLSFQYQYSCAAWYVYEKQHLIYSVYFYPQNKREISVFTDAAFAVVLC